jgi:hypothetical protein
MEERHLLIHLDDSETKRRLVEQAWLEADGRRDDLFQTDDPEEVLGVIRDCGTEALAVITDNEIEGKGNWAIKVAQAALRAGIEHILVYSGAIPKDLPAKVASLARTSNPGEDKAHLQAWLEREAHPRSAA